MNIETRYEIENKEVRGYPKLYPEMLSGAFFKWWYKNPAHSEMVSIKTILSCIKRILSTDDKFLIREELGQVRIHLYFLDQLSKDALVKMVVGELKDSFKTKGQDKQEFLGNMEVRLKELMEFLHKA